MTVDPSSVLAEWPADRPVGLIVFAAGGESLPSLERVLGRPGVVHQWWSATARNMVVGPAVEPPFGGAHIVELAGVDAATWFLDGLRETTASATTLAVVPIPEKEQRRLTRFQSLLRLLPSPGSTGGSLPPNFVGGVVSSEDQLRRLDTLPQEEPVVILSFNRYRDEAADPQTGETKSGEAVFEPYYRRALLTYSRVGAKVVWTGRCRGTVGGAVDMPAWHDVSVVSYPSLASFGRLAQNPGFQSKIGYRVAALEAAWVVMGQIQRSSEQS